MGVSNMFELPEACFCRRQMGEECRSKSSIVNCSSYGVYVQVASIVDFNIQEACT
jgi:hypothetical protein